MGIIKAVLKLTLVQIHTQTCVYKTFMQPVLCYGCEMWTIRKGYSERLTACKMKFMRRTVGYMKWAHKRDEDILTELKIMSVTDHIKHCHENRRTHVNRTNDRDL